MTSNDSSRMVTGYEYRFDFQPGWIDLTLEERDHAEAVILAGSAMKQFNPLNLVVGERELLRDLTDRALDLNTDEPILAAGYYSESGNGLANLRVDTYADEETPRPDPSEVVPLLLDWSNREIAGEPEIKYLDLDAGPAVRVQAMLKARRILGFGRQLSEFIDYAVFPPVAKHLVVVSVRWRSMGHTDELTRLTDELVATMRRVPVDADGDEIFPSS